MITLEKIFTPFRAILIIYIILTVFTNLGYALGWFWMYALIILAIDIIMVLIIKNIKRVSIIQTSIITLIYGYFWINNLISNQGNDITKTFRIPDNTNQKYIVVIYGIQDALELPSSSSDKDFEITLTNSLIHTTSTTIKNDNSKTKVSTHSGKVLNNRHGNNPLSFYELREDQITCSDQKYFYRTWMISDKEIYNWNEIDSLKIELTKIICNNN